MPQQIHPVNVVRAGDYASHQRTNLRPRVRSDLGNDVHVLSDQYFEADVLGQPHRRHQPSVRHEIRAIEHRVRLDRRMQQSHL